MKLYGYNVNSFSLLLVCYLVRLDEQFFPEIFFGQRCHPQNLPHRNSGRYAYDDTGISTNTNSDNLDMCIELKRAQHSGYPDSILILAWIFPDQPERWHHSFSLKVTHVQLRRVRAVNETQLRSVTCHRYRITQC